MKRAARSGPAGSGAEPTSWSFRKIADKYKGKADATDKLVQHLTSSPKVKLADGTEEEHKVIATRPAKDMAQVKNLVEYILAQTKK